MSFQGQSSKQGAEYERVVARNLRARGLVIEATHWRHPEAAVEIDIVASNAYSKYWFECKGSWRGTRPGLKRTDSVQKLLHSAAALMPVRSDWLYVCATNHLPKPGSSGATWIRHALENGILSAVWLITEEDREEPPLTLWSEDDLPTV